MPRKITFVVEFDVEVDTLLKGEGYDDPLVYLQKEIPHMTGGEGSAKLLSAKVYEAEAAKRNGGEG